MLIQKISNHLKEIAKDSFAVRKQFITSDEEEEPGGKLFIDPLEEEKFTKVKGLIHKYSNRVLILLTLQCAAYCRFCTRRRCVSEIEAGRIINADLLRMKSYIVGHPEIKEIILSGGDPLTAPELLIKALKLFSLIPQIKIIRIGTRVPVSEPKLVTSKLISVFKKVTQPLYVLIHFEHPDELTKETLKAIVKLRQAGAILYSQTVFLSKVNDSVDILYKLFSSLLETGVKPYYLFRSDPIEGTENFRVSFEKEIKIMTELRSKLSGLAYPLYVIDSPNGSGKIPVPLNFWKFDKSNYTDFNGKELKII